jgi:hypothetical protein
MQPFAGIDNAVGNAMEGDTERKRLKDLRRRMEALIREAEAVCAEAMALVERLRNRGQVVVLREQEARQRRRRLRR